MSGKLDLYQDAIKDMAAAGHGHGRLESPSGAAKLNNPLCGDRVQLEVVLGDGRISAIAHETRGCLLCKAAASLLGARAVGLDAGEVGLLVQSLESLLKDQAPAPPDWPELEMFLPAHAHPSRHKCALLPFRALQAALREANPAQ